MLNIILTLLLMLGAGLISIGQFLHWNTWPIAGTYWAILLIRYVFVDLQKIRKGEVS